MSHLLTESLWFMIRLPPHGCFLQQRIRPQQAPAWKASDTFLLFLHNASCT